MEIIETRAGHVHHGRGEYMGPGQCALLRERSLVALLETAAVSYATENSGNELGVVHVAEAVEQLVLSR